MAHGVGRLPAGAGRACWAGLLAIVLAGQACVTFEHPSLHETDHVRAVARANARDPQTLKVHLASGDLVVLTRWGLTQKNQVLEGQGHRYDPSRALRGTGPMKVPLAEVALLETNSTEHASFLAQLGLSTLTAYWGTATVVCAIDPKSCFGSCPTFYPEGGADRPVAEGFSSSIARALEARDLDALGDVQPRNGRLALVMKNEALETHAVRRVRLLAVERPPRSRVYATHDGRFRPLVEPIAPSVCRGPEGDCGPALSQPDGTERRSSADAVDLATREEVELWFPKRPSEAGLVIRARHSLLTTFLFYQTLGYLGRNAGAYLAALERGGSGEAAWAVGMLRRLGGIEVEVEDDGHWRPAGVFDEAGPIASDTQILPLPAAARSSAGPLRVRLRMAKGHYRIDWIALGEIGGELPARVIETDRVEKDGRPDPRTRALLREGRRHLITLPGDQYRLTFPLPVDGRERELFLESEGYYYEWMREDWLRDEDPNMALLVMTRPDEALRRLAGPFKAQEARADAVFWGSRYERKPR
jgi:hypothetical protein